MDIFETISLAIILIFGGIISYEDIKSGKIRNKYVLIILFAAISLNMLFFPTIDHFTIFSSNLIISTVVGVLLYMLKVWNPADAKLFIAFSSIIPITIYKLTYFQHFLGLTVIVNTFFIAFIYLLFTIFTRDSWNFEKIAFIKAIEPRSILNLLLFFMSFPWLLSLAFQLFGIRISSPFLYYVISIPVYTVLLKFLGNKTLGISILVSAIRFAVDPINFISFETAWSLSYSMIIAVGIFTFFRNISIIYFTKLVPISDLNSGSILVEYVFKDDEKYKKTLIREKSIIGDENGVIHEKDVELLKQLENKGSLTFQTIAIKQTMAFAPFLFAGVLATLIFQGPLPFLLKILF